MQYISYMSIAYDVTDRWNYNFQADGITITGWQFINGGSLNCYWPNFKKLDYNDSVLRVLKKFFCNTALIDCVLAYNNNHNGAD